MTKIACYDSSHIREPVMRPGVASSIFCFGLFEADAAGSTLMRNGVRVKIQDQPLRVLLLLLERPGEIVTREELRQSLWSEGTYVDFDGSLNVILKKLRAAIDDSSDNPRFIETVPRRGYRFIAPVSVDRKPGPPPTSPVAVKEPPDQESVVSIATATTTAAPPAATSRVKFFPRGLLMYGASGAVVAILLAAGWLIWRHKASDSARTPAAVRVRKSLAVLGFHGLSGKAEDAWLATALSEMLSTELSGGEKLRLVSGEDVSNLRLASPWSQTDTLDQGTTSRIGRSLSADMLVLGSYTIVDTAQHAQIRIDVRMQDAQTGEILSEIAEIGGAQDLFRLVSRVGGKLRDRLGVPPLEDNDEAGILASLPLDPDAARFYALGLAKLRKFDALAAKDLLLQATAADPKFSLGHAMLARAWSQLGYEQKRREEAKKALDLAGDLPRAEHMLVEGEYDESIGNQQQAASVYHALYELFPDNVEYGLRFVNAEVLSGEFREALAVIRQLRSLPAPASGDPRIDLAEARAIKVNKPASLALERRAVSKALTQGRTPIYALARRDECVDLLYTDHPEDATPVCEDAYDVFLSSGNRAGAADAIRLMADHFGSQGHYDQAVSTYQRALSILNGLGEHAKTGAILNNMAIVYANQGNLERANQLYGQAKSHFEQAGDKNNTSTAIVNMGDILFLEGHLGAAEKMYHQSLDFISDGDHVDSGYTLSRLADLDLVQGRPSGAKTYAEKAVESYRLTQGSYQYLTGAMVTLGEVLEAEGDLAGARSQFEQSLSIRQKVGEEDLVAESQVELATLAIEEGHPQQAEGLLRTAIAEFEKEKGDPDASSAYTQLSRALMMMGRTSDASDAIDRAVRFSQTSSDPALKLPAAIQKARVEMAKMASGAKSPVTTQQQLKSVAATAKNLGYYNLEAEARLAMAELAMKGNPAAARKQLAGLTSEAHEHGMELLARRAQSALDSSNNIVAENQPAQ